MMPVGRAGLPVIMRPCSAMAIREQERATSRKRGGSVFREIREWYC